MFEGIKKTVNNNRARILADNLAFCIDHKSVNLPELRQLLDAGADPNLSVRGLTALQRASIGKNASVEVVHLLLSAGANPKMPVQVGCKDYRLSSVVTSQEVKARLVRAEHEYKTTQPPPRPHRPTDGRRAGRPAP